MTIDNAIRELVVIGGRLTRILDDQGRRAIETARASLEAQKRARPPRRVKARRQRDADLKPWRVVIPPGDPISFRETVEGDGIKHQLQVDVSGVMTQPRAGVPRGPHSLCVRVWSRDERLWYRPHFDSEAIQHRVREASGRRVMLRFHFDSANLGQAGPAFHLQLGGVQREDEACWHPESLDVPRFVHHPVNLLMVCEFVAKTFYGADYDEIQRDATWRGALGMAEEAYLKPFFERCVRAAGGGPALLSLAAGGFLGVVWNR